MYSFSPISFLWHVSTIWVRTPFLSKFASNRRLWVSFSFPTPFFQWGYSQQGTFIKIPHKAHLFALSLPQLPYPFSLLRTPMVEGNDRGNLTAMWRGTIQGNISSCSCLANKDDKYLSSLDTAPSTFIFIILFYSVFEETRSLFSRTGANTADIYNVPQRQSRLGSRLARCWFLPETVSESIFLRWLVFVVHYSILPLHPDETWVCQSHTSHHL